MAYKGNILFLLRITNKTHVVREYCGINETVFEKKVHCLNFENIFAKANKFRFQMLGKTSRVYIL